MGLPQAAGTTDLELLLDVIPLPIRRAIEVHPLRDGLIEIVMDLGRPPEARFPARVELAPDPISAEDLRYVLERVGKFGRDNRAGIEATLHRISALRNRNGDVIGLTCRVGRAVFGTVDIVRDVIEAGRSTLLLGRPGVGKTTLLREAARVLADPLGKRVIVVDTSNEIAGDGNIPHPGIGRARRMQVPTPDQQHAVMIEAVENHMPEVVVIDEIGSEAEAQAARTIAERGVQLIATAHGNTLDNLLQNPVLSDLVGGIQSVTLSDEEARRRGTQKAVLERGAPPTFDVIVEIHAKDRLAVHHDVADTVDRLLRGSPPSPELRTRTPEGGVTIQQAAPLEPPTAPPAAGVETEPVRARGRKRLRVFPYAVSRSRLEDSIAEAGVPARVVDDLHEADVVLTVRSKARRQPKAVRDALARGVRIEVLRSNTNRQIQEFLRAAFAGPSAEDEQAALRQVETAVESAIAERRPVELAPQGARVRRLQHERVQRTGLVSHSRGKEPFRRVIVYPPS